MRASAFRLFLMILSVPLLQAQSPLDSLGAEVLFLKGRDLAFNGQRDSARFLLRLALKKSPDYADIHILLARTLAWDGKRAEARSELSQVIANRPGYKDAYIAAIDVELWDDKPAEALRLSSTAIRYFPNDEELLVKKAKAFRALNRDDEALITISIIEEINRSNPNIEAMRDAIGTKGILNSIGASYSYDWTSESVRPNQILSLQYSRSTRYGSFFGRVNMADRRRKTKFQYELEGYPSIMPGVYGYVNYAYSDTARAILFPAHRIGLELFFSLPASFEGSIGSRHLFFDPKPVNIYTGSLGYYYGSYWFSLRTYITPGAFSASRSLALTTRWYYGGDGDYLFGKVGGGVSPDEDRFVDTTGAQLYNIGSTGAGVGGQFVFSPYLSLNTSFDFSSQELSYRRGDYMDVYSFSLSIKYKF